MHEFVGAQKPEVETTWTPLGPLELRGTLFPLQHGASDPSMRLVADGAWRAVHTPDGPATVRITRIAGSGCGADTGLGPGPRDATGPRRPADGMVVADVDPTAEGERHPHDARPTATGSRHATAPRRLLVYPTRGDAVRIQAWGPGAKRAAAAVPAWLGAADDWTGFDAPAFSATLPPGLDRVRRERLGLRLPSGGALADTLTAIVMQQRVTTIEAHYGWRRLVTRFGEDAPGPRPASTTADGRSASLKLPPSAEAWRRIPSWEWHQARVDASRRNTIVRVAERAAAWRRWEESENLQALDAAMRSLPGVGVWTVAETLQRTHGAPDHVSFGDFHVAHFVGQALTGRRTDDAGMARLLAPWAGHRQRVVRLLYASGAKNPSYGPRLAPHDHRGH